MSLAVEKLAYSTPDVIPSESFVHKIRVYDPTNLPAQGYWSSNNATPIKIGIQGEDNEFLDSDNCYLSCDIEVINKYAALTPLANINTERSSRTFCCGSAPFKGVRELIGSSNLELSNIPDRWARLNGKRAWCQGLPTIDTSSRVPALQGANADYQGIPITWSLINGGAGYSVNDLLEVPASAARFRVTAVGAGGVITALSPVLAVVGYGLSPGVVLPTAVSPAGGTNATIRIDTVQSRLSLDRAKVWNVPDLHGQRFQEDELACKDSWMERAYAISDWAGTTPMKSMGGYHAMIPLRELSCLASSHHYIPLNYLTRTGSLSLQFEITLPTDAELPAGYICSSGYPNADAPFPFDSEDVIPQTFELRIRNVSIQAKNVLVRSPEANEQFLSKFLMKVSMVKSLLPTGQEVETPLVQRMLMPYVRLGYDSATLRGGSSSHTLSFNVEEDSLMAIMLGFTNQSIFDGSSFTEKFLADQTDYELAGLSVSVGNYLIYSAGSLRANTSASTVAGLAQNTSDMNRQMAMQYLLGRNIFGVNRRYSQTGAWTRFNNASAKVKRVLGGATDPISGSNVTSTLQDVWSGGAPNFFLIPMENFGLSEHEDSGVKLFSSRGVNTKLHGRNVKITLEWSSPIPNGQNVDLEFYTAAYRVEQVSSQGVGDVSAEFIA